MNKFNRILGLLALIVAVAACSEKDDKKKPGTAAPQKPVAQAQDLSGKTTAEVLTIKYDKADLVCGLWYQVGSEPATTQKPNDLLTVDLRTADLGQTTLKLQTKVDDRTVAFDFTANSLTIASTRLTTLDGTRYALEHSPVVELSYRYKETFGNTGNSISGQGPITVFEKVSDPALRTREGAAGDPAAYYLTLKCTVDTVIKPEYAGQFAVVP